MAKTLTAANSVILLTIPSLFPIAQQLQGYAADDVFDTDQLETAETMMGVDGKLSGGWIPKEVKQNFTLQADSDSVAVFEVWYAAQQSVRELYYASGAITLPAVNRKLIMTKGILTGYSPSPNAKKILQPRKFTITWEAITTAPF
jgi:hypothetical protein